MLSLGGREVQRKGERERKVERGQRVKGERLNE